jgi:protein required for attachment to host cells
MAKRKVTWFVLADGSRARFLTKRPETAGYDIVAEYESAEAHVPSHEIGSDRPGRSRESAASARHSITPREDIHRARKASFARDIAAHLNEAGRRGLFDTLVIYAAPRALGELRTALNAEAQKRIKAEIPKDLTRLPLAELPLHFQEFV